MESKLEYVEDLGLTAFQRYVAEVELGYSMVVYDDFIELCDKLSKYEKEIMQGPYSLLSVENFEYMSEEDVECEVIDKIYTDCGDVVIFKVLSN